METNPLVSTFRQIPADLGWGPPYWPEIAIAIATVTCVLWLIMRRKSASEASPQSTSDQQD